MARTAAVLGVVLLAVTAGCGGSLLGAGGNRSISASTGPPTTTDADAGPDRMAAVPDNVTFLVRVDAAILADPPTSAVVDGYLNATVPPGGDRPRTLAGLVDRVESELTNESNLSTDGLEAVTAFGRVPARLDADLGRRGPYAGVFFRADWNESDVLAVLRSDYETDRTTYDGETVYLANVTGATLAYASRGDRHLLGTRRTVEDAIDAAGDPGPTGRLRRAYRSTPSDALVRLAVAIPRGYRRGLAESGAVDVVSLENVTHVALAYSTEGDRRGRLGLNVSLYATDAEVADTLHSQLNGLRLMGKSYLEREYNGTLSPHLDRISVSVEGPRVDLSYAVGVGNLTDLIDRFLANGTGAGGANGTGAGGTDAGRTDAGGTADVGGGDAGGATAPDRVSSPVAAAPDRVSPPVAAAPGRLFAGGGPGRIAADPFPGVGSGRFLARPTP